MRVRLTLTHDPPTTNEGFQFRVLNAGGQDVAGTETNAPSPRMIEFNVDPGVYTLLVDGRGSVVGRSYHISGEAFDPDARLRRSPRQRPFPRPPP